MTLFHISTELCANMEVMHFSGVFVYGYKRVLLRSKTQDDPVKGNPSHDTLLTYRYIIGSIKGKFVADLNNACWF